MMAQPAISTPPHHPTYDVRLSQKRIDHIVSTLWPNHTANVTEFPRGTSYNNRLYSVNIVPSPPLTARRSDVPLRAVLKLGGHFFNHTKVQNEVASLLLLTRHCPSIPVPLVLAWSEDGKTIVTYDKCIPDESSPVDQRTHGWILLSHLPGRTLTSADLDSSSGTKLFQQLAQFNYSWRTNMPSVPMLGNIRQQSVTEAYAGGSPPNDSVPPLHHAYTIGGFLLCHRYDPGPIHTKLDYYKYMLKDQIHRVMTSTAYDEVRCDLVPLAAEFVEWQLPWLTCIEEKTRDGQVKGVFSHMDFAPRNVLVDDDGHGSLKVTGMVDWEFAAFLPAYDEFTNAYVRQEGDWEPRHYVTLMTELGKLGCRVPPLKGVEAEYTIDKVEWQELCLLWKLIDNIAPWDIMEGKLDSEELHQRLDKAGRVVRDAFRELRALHSSKPKEEILVDGEINSEPQSHEGERGEHHSAIHESGDTNHIDSTQQAPSTQPENS